MGAEADSIRRDLTSSPDRFGRAVELYAAGSFDRAEALCREIIRVDSRHFDALLLLANLQLRLRRPMDALASYGRALAVDPNDSRAHYNRGTALHGLRRFDEALTSYHRALALKPDFVAALVNRGVALRELGRLDEALESYRRALAIDSAHAGALFSRGNVLRDLRRYGEALDSYRGALAIRPDHAEALRNCALTLHDLKRFADELAIHDRILAIEPHDSEAWNNRGLALWHLRRLEEALESYDRALAISPDYAEALNNRGPALWDLQRVDEALATCARALAIRPDHAEVLYNRGVMLQDLGRHEAAIADFERVLAINPDYNYVKGLRLHAKLNCCDWRGLGDGTAELAADVRAKKCGSNPFAFLGLSATARDQLACAQTWVRDKCPASPAPLWQGERYAHDRIRVAYLSADFHDHPMPQLLAGVFERHDRARFETFAFSFAPQRRSAMQARLRGAFERFLDVRDQDDRQVAGRMRDLEIDIAVDLMGFTRDARPRIFSLRPAPVQVNYLGLNASMGAGYIDYIVADRHVIPDASRDCYAEKVVSLPDTFQGNDATRPIGCAGLDRGAAGLPDTGFVFCSFNNSYKITPTMFDIWARLMRSVDGSVLWLLAGSGAVERNLRHEAQDRGVAPERLIFAPRAPYDEYMARFRLADLFLDTLPFNGCTTASDALWNGLPLVTASGETFVSRMAGSILRAAGLPDLVAGSLAEYEALALKLARDADALAAIRTRLAGNRATCPLFDTDRFRRHLEAAYVTMWKRSQRGEPPASFAVGELDV